ncbi:MAG: elongation factor P maturation arginine rhamnosyltransferase EarP [Tepidimonas sp.]|uniref:elongation factor P maturation arginine rhamnosyltransferase EarP n=1 Tax=Tepidimonas sp. TaxID=2002775 RepID=UPI00259DEC0E|nr:elongation factor P maturation arginine rhamnosyltransferase EarP [Tepidimonas sp.]MDM7456210.1 elongation factor P maturation arginine rhamnosyltransferase EarP [Tepidimonas sp.]
MSGSVLHSTTLAAGDHDSSHCTAPAVVRPSDSAVPPLTWDVFCHVIDNWGDVGVCWRLCRQLAAAGQRVRLWIDEADALDWMAPGARAGRVSGVQVHPWPSQRSEHPPPHMPPADVLVEAFGCHVPDAWVAALLPPTGRDGRPTVWLNLEYLSAEPWVARSHGLPSPVLSGPLTGRTKWFFFPGFTPDTGGLLREADLGARQQGFDAARWRAAYGSHDGPWVSVFTYEPAALATLQRQPALAAAHWLVAPGRSAVHWGRLGTPLPAAARVTHCAPVPQDAFDERLWACDLNLVRGEDSLVRALWAGRAFLWQLYPQDDGAHHDKLEAFLAWLDAPADWQAWLRAWNGIPGPDLPALTPTRLAQWQAAARATRDRLWAQDDLLTRLLAFVHERRAKIRRLSFASTLRHS